MMLERRMGERVATGVYVLECTGMSYMRDAGSVVQPVGKTTTSIPGANRMLQTERWAYTKRIDVHVAYVL